jgi:hypothetical protein
VMTERRRCPPAPPADFSADLPTIQLRANPHAWVRVFWKSRRPLTFAKSRHGNRFDPLAAPWDKTRVLYAGTTLEVAIAEALLRWHGEILPGESVSLSKSGDLRVWQVLDGALSSASAAPDQHTSGKESSTC